MRSIFIPLGLAAAVCSPLGFAQPIFFVPPTSAVSASAREAAHPLTLDEALRLAVAWNYSLSGAKSLAAASEGGVTQAQVIPNPQLEVLVEDTQKSTRTTTGVLNIPVELGGKRSARIKSAELGRDIAQADLLAVGADIRAQTILAFFDVLIAQERVDIALGSVENAAGAARVAGRRVAAGKTAPLEESKARVEVANAGLEADEASNELQLARQRLSSLWGSAIPGFTKASGHLDPPSARPALDDLRAELLQAPRLRAARLAADKGRAQIGVERSKQYPDITISVGAKRDNELGRNQAVLGVSVPLPFFDRNQGNLYAATMQGYKAQDDYRSLEVQMMAELQQASSQFDLSRASAKTLESTILPEAIRAYETARKGFEAGKFGFLEVLDAQRTLSQARVRYLSVLSRTYQAVAQIDRILGR
jgi:cobalt-zinc-cadmium efflux system outer membrane protein